MWLLPIAFMIHDFEEIIMMRPWYLKNGAYLKARFPRFFNRMSSTAGLSTPAFSLAVLGEFVILSAATLACVELGAYPAWAAVAVIFLVHNVVHIGSFFIVGRYVPFVITGVITSAYPIYALATLYGGGYLVPQDVMVWLAVALVPAGIGFFIIIRAAARFDRWLERWSVPG
ncbi:MAG: hypothetical protein A4E28_00878 [Methanocella sp. PtaU1.Bin125]|nr:MAG: hypothetical protein A4E28_00878 [Methanocella sp. PtaU1.Bin125]